MPSFPCDGPRNENDHDQHTTTNPQKSTMKFAIPFINLSHARLPHHSKSRKTQKKGTIFHLCAKNVIKVGTLAYNHEQKLSLLSSSKPTCLPSTTPIPKCIPRCKVALVLKVCNRTFKGSLHILPFVDIVLLFLISFLEGHLFI